LVEKNHIIYFLPNLFFLKKGTSTTLCVRRATYFDPELGKDDPAKKGVCSNFLADAKPGDSVQLTGPTGKVMLLPANPNSDLILIATGTGIAPYRFFIIFL
jgi:ferredoxin--NADP+ reductase